MNISQLLSSNEEVIRQSDSVIGNANNVGVISFKVSLKDWSASVLEFMLVLQAHKQSVLHLHHLLVLEQLIKFQELSLQSRLMITRLNLPLQLKKHSKQLQRFLISPALELVHLTDLYQSIKTPRVFWLLIMLFNHQSLQLPLQLTSTELQHLVMIE